MRLLDRYLLRELFVPLGYCLGGLLIFWISFDLFGELKEFQKNHLTVGEVATYYVFKLPELLVLILPITLLLALLYALTTHARYNELTAMRAAGIPLWRLCLPYLFTGFVLSVLLFLLNEVAAPAGTEAADRLSDKGTKEKLFQRNVSVDNTQAGRKWVIDSYNLKTSEMEGLQLDWILTNGILRVIDAKRVLWTNGHWLLLGVEQTDYPRDPTALPLRARFSSLALHEVRETPRLIRSEIKINKVNNFRQIRRAQLSLLEMLDYRKLHPKLDRKRRDWITTKLHSRLAAPWTCLIVVLIAIPFGAGSGRRNAFVGVASSVFLCFTFFVLKELSLALGTGGLVAPIVAAWLPNLVFGAAGLLLTMKVR